MSPSNSPDKSPPVSASVWLPFEGTAALSPNQAVLHPKEDPNINMYFDLQDVGFLKIRGGSEILVRQGCSMLEIVIPPTSPFLLKRPAPMPSIYCNGTYSYCLGGLEYCCNYPKIVQGNCSGTWVCGP